MNIAFVGFWFTIGAALAVLFIVLMIACLGNVLDWIDRTWCRFQCWRGRHHWHAEPHDCSRCVRCQAFQDQRGVIWR